MEAHARRPPADEIPDLSPDEEAAVKAVGAWVQLFARTFKNCRLYDARNPSAVRFREQLGTALQQVIADRGEFTLTFTANDVTCHQQSLYPAKSRDDNLALPFYRDGVRAITFEQGIHQNEVDALLQALIQVTTQTEGEDDLVTLMWQARLEHMNVDFVPVSSEITSTDLEGVGELVPWPAPQVEADEVTAAATATEEAPAGEERSDDWAMGTDAGAAEAGFAELEALGPAETDRFVAEFRHEQDQETVMRALMGAKGYLASEAAALDIPDLLRYLPRVLRVAVQQGSWQEAAELHGMLLQHATGGEWSVDTFAQELQQPISIASFTNSLNRQDDSAATAFAVFAATLGESGVDLMHHVMIEIESARAQRTLSDAIVAACREHPERLAPYLGDPRPAVARSVVQMLAAIGGTGMVGLLQAALNHSDGRVRYEVVAALRNVEPKLARPLLLKLVQSDDSRTFQAALLMLAERRDPQVARFALELSLGPDFEQRSNDEKRAIYSALGSAGGDELIPELEAELLKGGWFQRGNEGHRQAIARCIARIGTPMAREVIEEGSRSRRGPIRDLCEELLQRWEQRRG